MKHASPAHLFFLLLLPLLFSACAANAGIFAGGNWQAGGLSHQHIRTLEVDPHNPQAIYAGDAQDGIFVTNDSGQHWMQRNLGLPLPLVIQFLAFDGPGKKLYAATDKGLFVSADAAQHWQSIGQVTAKSPAMSYTALAFDLHAPHTIYVGTLHQGVFISTDDGRSWSPASTGLHGPINWPSTGEPTINGLTFDSDHHQLWAATTLGVYRSDDRGASWHAFNTGLPADAAVYDVRPASVSGGAANLIFAGTNNGFFRSENAGAHWARGRQAFSGTSIHQIYVDFRTPTTLYVATDAGAFRSEDSGQSWGGIASGLPKGASVYALTLGADNYSQLYAAVNGIYLYPGTSGGLSSTRIIQILLILVFFYLLYRIATRGRRRAQRAIVSEQSGNAPLDIEGMPQGKTQFNGTGPTPQRQEVVGDEESEKGS